MKRDTVEFWLCAAVALTCFWLLTACALIPPDPPYWFPDKRLACDVEPVIVRAESSQRLSAICGMPRTEFDACITVRPGFCRIALGPRAGDCELSHELRHAKGWNHDKRPVHRQDCG